MTSAENKEARFAEARQSDHEQLVEEWGASVREVPACNIHGEDTPGSFIIREEELEEGQALMRAPRPASARLPAVLSRLSQALGNPCLDFSKTTIEDALVDYAIDKLRDRPASAPGDLVALVEKAKRMDDICTDDLAPWAIDIARDLGRVDLAKATPAADTSEAYGYLTRLFKTYAPQCEPLGDLLGVCSQIDNMLVGMREKATPAAVQVPEHARAWARCVKGSPDEAHCGSDHDIADWINSLPASASEPAPEPESKPTCVGAIEIEGHVSPYTIWSDGELRQYDL